MDLIQKVISMFSSQDQSHREYQMLFDRSDEPTKRMIQDFLQKINKLSTDCEKLRKEKDQLVKYNGILENSEQKLKELNETQRKFIQSLQSEPQPKQTKQPPIQPSSKAITDTMKMIDDCLGHQNELQAEKEKLSKRIELLEKDRNVLMEENSKFKRENQILLSEKDNALSRLSKIAGIQLTKGNSDIADLSDANRPTKIGEKWSSLYTDEWSEAYDEITKKRTLKNENCAAEKELFKIVQICYKTCQEMEQKQMKDIKSHAWDIASCLHQQPDQLVSAVQTSQYHRVVVENGDIKAATINPKQMQQATQHNKEVVGNVDTKAITINPRHMQQAEIQPDTIRAIQKCMEELIQIVRERRKYDKFLLEYVQKAILVKFEKYAAPGSAGHVIKFVKRCTELCWNMVIKEPPMVLVYDQLEGTKIDKNLFSVYTKNGAVIDFVIWPALKLHLTGPVIAKGTAQMKDVPVVTKGEVERDNATKKDIAPEDTKEKERNVPDKIQNSEKAAKGEYSGTNKDLQSNVDKTREYSLATFIQQTSKQENQDDIKVTVSDREGISSISVKDNEQQ